MPDNISDSLRSVSFQKPLPSPEARNLEQVKVNPTQSPTVQKTAEITKNLNNADLPTASAPKPLQKANIKSSTTHAQPGWLQRFMDRLTKIKLTKLFNVSDTDANKYIKAKNTLNTFEKEMKNTDKTMAKLAADMRKDKSINLDTMQSFLSEIRNAIAHLENHEAHSAVSELPNNSNTITINAKFESFKNQIANLKQQEDMLNKMIPFTMKTVMISEKKDSNVQDFSDMLIATDNFMKELKDIPSQNPKIPDKEKKAINSKDFKFKDAIDLAKKHYPHLTPFLEKTFKAPMKTYIRHAKRATEQSEKFDAIVKNLQTSRETLLETTNKLSTQKRDTRKLHNDMNKLESSINNRLNRIAELKLNELEIKDLTQFGKLFMSPELQISQKVVDNSKNIGLMTVEAKIDNRLRAMQQIIDKGNNLTRDEYAWIEKRRDEIFILALQAQKLSFSETQRTQKMELHQILTHAFPYKKTKANDDNQKDIFTRLKPIQASLSNAKSIEGAFSDFNNLSQVAINQVIDLKPDEFKQSEVPNPSRPPDKRVIHPGLDDVFDVNLS